MRKELIEIEKIESYLLHQMNPLDKKQFEGELNSNPDLKAKVEAQQLVMDAVQRLALKASTKTAYKRFKLKALLTKLIALIAIIGVVTFITLQLINPENGEHTVETSKKLSLLPINDTLSNYSNQLVKEEVFQISTNKDTVIENKDGVVIYIPANAFDSETNVIDLVVQSAINGEDILYAGLSTTSNGDALETGGMFYIDAFENGKRINLVKDLQVDVPTNNKVDGMQVYTGEKTKDGEINWVNPTPLKNKLTPVDILSLDFYPPTYDTKLTEWGHPKKEFKDSLYYSFAFEETGISLSLDDDFYYPKRRLLRKEATLIYGKKDNRAMDNFMTKEEAEVLKRKKNSFGRNNLPGPEIPILEVDRINNAVDLKLTTQSNQNRADDEMPSSVDDVIKWGFKSKYIGNNDYEIIITVLQFNGWHIYSQKQPVGGISFPTEFNFKGEGINLIGETREYGTTLHEGQFPERVFCGSRAIFKQKIHVNTTTTVNIEYEFMACLEACFAPEFRSHLLKLKYFEGGESLEQVASPQINPATIKTIWQVEFNNTNLATTQFEERLFWIHKACSQSVLELYINNLDKPLSEIDSMAIDRLSGTAKAKFIEFAKRNDGKVDLDDSASKRLSEFYKRKSKVYAKALAETQTKYWNNQSKLDNDFTLVKQKGANRDYTSKTDVFVKELQKNLCEVYDELNYPYDCNRTPSIPAKRVYSATITTTGWHNIDKQVSIATLNRGTTTLSYKGKTSTLTYHEWTGKVKDYQKYNRITVYNVPKSFNSYVKIKGKKGSYDYKLNSNLEYETVVLAWSDTQFFYATTQTKKGVESFNLKPISEQEFKIKIKSKLNHISGMSQEIDLIIMSKKNKKRKEDTSKRKALRQKVEPIVFPCDCKTIVDSTDAYLDIELIGISSE